MRKFAYSAGLLLALATALPAYVNSTFLSERLGESAVGSVFALSAVVSLLALSAAPALINRLGLKTLVIITSLITALGAFTLTLIEVKAYVILIFIVFSSFNILLRLSTDIYLEESSQNNATGTIRGIFLTLINLGWLISPLLAAKLIELGNYTLLYTLTGILFLPLGLLIIKSHKLKVKKENVWLTMKSLIRARDGRLVNLRRILLVDLWLNVFYALMVVYMPIYLHQHVGLSWASLGIVFTWMLLPFVLLDYPLGRLADKKWGEKEILAAGLVVAGLATIVSSTIDAPDIFMWSVILFLTRVGAASVEIMKETYLFKKINENDLDILSLSRNLIPVSYIIGPIIALVIISLFPLNILFTLLGLSAFLLLPIVWKLADTK